MQAMVIIVATWLMLIGGLCGVGTLLPRAFGVRLVTIDSWFMAFWGGFALVIAFLQWWHFAFPVNDDSRVGVMLVAALGLMLNRHTLWTIIRRQRRVGWVFIGLVLLFAFWLANRSLPASEFHDTGMYHLNAVRWTSTYPIVPGLGNLHSRLGFSTGFFLFTSLLNAGPWLDKTFHITNGVLYLVLMAQSAWAVVPMLRSGHTDSYHFLLFPFSVVVWFLLLTGTIIPSISNDPSIFVLGVVVAAQIIYLIEAPHLSKQQTTYRVIWIVLLSSAGVAIKYNFAVMGVGFCLMALYIWNQRFGSWWLIPALTRLGVISMVAGVIILPAMARSIILTGYPGYPLTVAPVAVEWRIDEDYAHLETEFIRNFARNPQRAFGKPPPGWGWLGIWLDQRFRPNYLRDHIYFSIPFVTSVGAAVLLGGGLSRHKRVKVMRWVFFLPLLASLVFWFVVAPAPRFSGASIWLLSIGLITLLFEKIGWGQHRWHIHLILAALIVATPMPFVLSKSVRPWIEPGPVNGLYRLPKPILNPYVTESRLFVWTSAKNNQCWDAPLPCTPYPHPNLRLRVEDDISQGFVLPIGPDDPPQIID